MDIKERLSFESVSEHTLIACEHLHRYQLAAQLCMGLRVADVACGTGYGTGLLAETAKSAHGVDNDTATVDLAEVTVGQRSSATFEAADAIEFLQRDLSREYDAIVCFEGLEHFDRPAEAIQSLVDHAGQGIRIVVSIPNSGAFDEENEFHITNFDYEQAMDVLGKLPGAAMLYQFLAEGSVICATEANDLDAQLVNLDQGEPEYANHFLIAANFDEGRLLDAHRSRMQLSHAPVYNSYMRSLEQAAEQLRFRNNELSRKLASGAFATAAKADSAAASLIKAVSRRMAELEEALTKRDHELSQRDEQILRLERDLFETRKELALQPKVAS